MKSFLPVKYLLLLLTLSVLSLTYSCNHRDFLYEEPSKRVPVTVRFDWTKDPGAAPQGMTVYFFRVGSQRPPAAYDIQGREGGTLSLMPGVYRAIAHNNDSDRHGFTSYDDYDGFGIRLNDHRNNGNVGNNSPVFNHSLDERLAHSPDSIWVAAIEEFEIKSSGVIVESREPVELTFRMLPVVHHYTFFIHNPINFHNSITVTATLSGLASTIHPARGVAGEETVTHLFPMGATADGGLFGEILTFGHCSGGALTSRDDEDPDFEDNKPHILVVQAALNDGSVWTSSHDVTNQIHGSLDPDCVIRLDSLAFPQPGAGGGFSPSVGGWPGSSVIIGM